MASLVTDIAAVGGLDASVANSAAIAADDNNWRGLVPGQVGTAGKVELLGISK